MFSSASTITKLKFCQPIANGTCFMRLLCYLSSRISYYTRAPLFPTINPFPFNLPLFSQPFAISYFVFGFFELPLFRVVARKKYVKVSKWLLLTFVALGLKSTPFQYLKPQCMVEWKYKDHIIFGFQWVPVLHSAACIVVRPDKKTLHCNGVRKSCLKWVSKQ